MGVHEGLGTASGFNKDTGIFSEAWALQQHLLVRRWTLYMPVFRSWWTETAEVRCAHISRFRVFPSILWGARAVLWCRCRGGLTGDFSTGISG